jgi:hypothetical protein
MLTFTGGTFSGGIYFLTEYIAPTTYFNTTITDPYFSSVVVAINANAIGGSTFISDASTNNYDNVSIIGDTRPTNFHPYQEGYYTVKNDATGIIYGTSPTTITGAFTFEGWFYFNSFTTNTFLMGLGTNTGGQTPYYFFGLANSGTTLHLDLTSSVTGQYAFENSYTFSTGKWYHLAVASNGTTVTFFVNGVAIPATLVSGTYPNAYQPALYPYVGGIFYGGGGARSDGLNGFVYNCRYVNGYAVYTTNFTPSTAPLTSVLGTFFLTCQSNRFIDNSPINQSLKSVGAISIVSGNPFLQTPDAVNIPILYSTKFNGGTDQLSIPYNSALSVSGTSWTVEAFIYVTATTAAYTQWIVGNRNQAPGYNFSWAFGLSGATPYLNFIDSGGTNYISSTTACPLNQWVHVAATYNGTSLSMYQNGSRVYGPTAMSFTDYTYPLTIGNYPVDTPYFQGHISNLRMVKGSPLYTGTTYTVPTSALTAIANTVLLTCQNSTFKDNSTNNFILTSVGTVQPEALTPFTQSYTRQLLTTFGSTYFDGSGDYLIAPVASAPSGLEDFTIEFWYYATSRPSFYPTIWSSGGTYSATTYLGIYDRHNTTPTVFRIEGAGTTVAGTTAVQSNTWYHVAVTRKNVSGTYTMSLFVNGVLEGSSTAASGSLSPVSCYFSRGDDASHTAGYTYINGYISDARIVKGTALYTSNFTPPTATLTPVANTQLLTLQNKYPVNNHTFVDDSAYKHLITRYGDSTQGSFNPYGSNWSVLFNNTSLIQTPASSTTSIIGGTGSITTGSTFTIEAWIYQTQRHTYGGSGNIPVLIGDMGSNGNLYWGFGPDPTGKLAFYHYTGSQVLSTGSDTIPLNTWTHIAISISNGAIKLFVNGNLQTITGASTTSAQSGTFGYLQIGTFYTGGTSYGYSGYISNLRITKAALYSGSFTPSAAPQTAGPTTGLMVCTDNTFIDRSPNNLALTISTDGPKVQRFSPFGNYIVTPVSYSTYFNGTTDYLTTSNTLNLTGDFTIEAWVYQTVQNTFEMIFGTGVNYFATGATNTFEFGIGVAGGYSYPSFTNGSTLPLNQWNHVALTRQGSSIKAFLNGLQVGSTVTNSTPLFSTGPLYIGQQGQANYYYYHGTISNVRVVKDVAIYTGNFTRPTAPFTLPDQRLPYTIPASPGANIVGITREQVSLLTCQSNTIIDVSTNAANVVAFASAKPVEYNPFGYTTNSYAANTTATNFITNYAANTYGGSVYMDGSGDYLSIPANGAFTFGTNDHTIEFWYYLPTSSFAGGYSTQWFYSQGSSSQATNNYTFQTGTASGGSYALLVGSSGAWGVNISAASGENLNFVGRWTHVAITRASNTFRLFFNGVLKGSAVYAGSITAQNGPMTLGQADANYAGGYYSNFRVVNGTALYTKPFIPPTSPPLPVANTVLLLNMQNAPVFDTSMNTQFEHMGDVRLTTAVKKFGTASLKFDGTGDYIISPTSANTIGIFTGDFTVESWVYPTITGTDKALWCLGTEATNRYVSYILASGRLGTNRYGYGTNTSVNTVVANTWTHLAAVRSSNVVTWYINGVADSNTEIQLGTIGNGRITFGADSSGSSSFSGYMDDIRVTANARYLSNFTPATSEFTQSNTTVTTTTTASVYQPFVVNYLVVAGGGSGGTGGNFAGGGGGGGGGYRLGTNTIVASTTISIVIGAGGSGANPGAAGTTSSYGVYTSQGGGRGGGWNIASQSGGSGGGAGYGNVQVASASTAAPPELGNAGGNGISTGGYPGGGGGGAGSRGNDAPSSGVAGNGGAGLASSISESITYYSGGGGAGIYTGTSGTGGTGGGGNGGHDAVSSTDGASNTGGGGGGSHGNSSGLINGGNGGSGVVILSHQNTLPVAIVTGSPLIRSLNGNIIYTFTQSGTITF